MVTKRTPMDFPMRPVFDCLFTLFSQIDLSKAIPVFECKLYKLLQDTECVIVTS